MGFVAPTENKIGLQLDFVHDNYNWDMVEKEEAVYCSCWKVMTTLVTYEFKGRRMHHANYLFTLAFCLPTVCLLDRVNLFASAVLPRLGVLCLHSTPSQIPS